MNEQILAALQPIFQEVFENPKLKVDGADSASTVDGWDSLTHVNLIMSVESAFGVRFALGELEEDWRIIELQDDFMHFEHTSGGNGDTDVLKFTKI